VRHIYVHVPFCARRCSYCDFSIAVRKTIPADQFVSAIEAELSLRREQGEWDDSPTATLYFGGGTPSLLPADHIARLIEVLNKTEDQEPKTQDPRPKTEITLEANPDDVTPANAAAWLAGGVNRISLGAQSFEPQILKWMHRTHDENAIPRAVGALRGAGIENISLDLIFALPHELGSVFEQDLTHALALEPRHLSIYGLSVEARTPLARWIDRGASSPPGEDRYAEDFLLAHRVLGGAGFEHYEVSNYALPGQESRHNSAYWRDQPYAGLVQRPTRFPAENAAGTRRHGPRTSARFGMGWTRRWSVNASARPRPGSSGSIST